MLRLISALLLFIACNDHSATKVVNIKDSLAGKERAGTDTSIKRTQQQIDTINTGHQPVALKPVSIRLTKGDSFNLFIPEGYNISIAAEGLQRLRFLSMSPDGRLFATDMYDRSDNHKGRVLVFENWNDSVKKFEKQVSYLTGLHNPNQVAFYNGYIYVAETDRINRYAYMPGKEKPADTGQLIMKLPAYGLGYKYGGWHLTRSVAFHNDKLYISVGSSCNACIEKEDIRASVIEMDPDGKNVKHFARGLRNSVGLKWVEDDLWATGMGRDLIGPDKPEDLFQKIERDGYYGWPYYFQFRQKIYEDEAFKDSARPAWVTKPPVAFLGFKAHSAPLGFEYFKGFKDPAIQNSILVCLHGSTSVWRQRGNSIVKVEKGNRYTEIITGFLTGKTEADRHGRPCDILMKNENSFFFTDDLNGILYYLWK